MEGVMPQTGWMTGVLLLSVVAPTSAAVLCQKKSGAVFVRAACKKRETLVDPVGLNLQGPKGDAGAPGSARAYAFVNRFNPTTLDPATTKGFTAVSHPSTGVYCLTPPVGVSPASAPPVLTVEYGKTALLDSYVQWESLQSCPQGTYQVVTLDSATVAGNLQPSASSDTVSFTIIVP
jgi:hypothetical protein